MKPTLVVDTYQGLLLVVHGPLAPSTEDWSRYLDALRPWCKQGTGQLVYTLGGMPDSVQRSGSIAIGKELLQERIARGEPVPRTAVMTNSTAARALATLFNWFFDNSFRGFALDDWRGASDHLRVEMGRRDELRELVVRMARRVE